MNESEQKAYDHYRAIACVKACEDIDDPLDLRRQRDELLAACRAIQVAHRMQRSANKAQETAMVATSNAIANAEKKP